MIDAVRKAQKSGATYAALSESVDLREQRQKFIDDDDIWQRQAWNAYFLAPGIKSAWVSLGFDIPDEE